MVRVRIESKYEEVICHWTGFGRIMKGKENSKDG